MTPFVHIENLAPSNLKAMQEHISILLKDRVAVIDEGGIDMYGNEILGLYSIKARSGYQDRVAKRVAQFYK
jgi:hypothetical protein